LTAKGELGLAIAIAQKAVVADTLEAVGQDMQQETANELLGLQCHGLLPVVMAIISPMKADLAVANAE